MLPEGLSMLWETHDPGLALADRFGFRDRAHVRAWLADTLAEVWGLDIGECDRLVISDHNAIAWATSVGHGPLGIKWSMEAGLLDRLHAAATVLSRLAGPGAGCPWLCCRRSRDSGWTRAISLRSKRPVALWRISTTASANSARFRHR